MLNLEIKKKIKPYKKRRKKKSENFFDNQPELMKLLAPEVIQEKRDYIYMGDNRYARIFSIIVYPNEIWIGWLDDILNTMGDVDISIQVQVADERNIEKYLTHKITKLRSDYMLFQNQGNINELNKLEENIRSFEEMRRNIQINNDKMFFIKILLRVNAENLKELNEKSKLLRNEFANRSCEIRPTYFKQLDALKETLPVNNNIIKEDNRNMTTTGLAQMFPIARTKSSIKEGIYFGRDMFTGLPMNLETFTKDLANANIAIFGVTGAGKSVTVKTIVGRTALINRRASILDIEGEYVSLTEKLGGRIIKVRQGVPVGINLFDIDINEDDEFIDIDSKIIEIRAIISGIINKYENRTLKPSEIADIETAVKEVYRKKGITKDLNSIYEKEGGKIKGKITFGNIKKKMPTLSDFHRILSTKKNSKELAEILSGFLKGKSLGMFDCTSNININDYLIDFDLSSITDEVTKFYASMVITTWITEKYMRRSEVFDEKSVYIDEAWTMIRYEETANFIENLARRARKRGVRLVFSTQLPDEMMSSPQGRATLNCCGTAILMKQSPMSVDQILEYYKLSSGTREFLLKARPGEAILYLEGTISAIAIETLDKEEEMLKV